ncbi:MAG: site-2 protease family protein, partial [Actinobacteria bacterium]|nr:site-2 protease family protein [Actinomycetota bacterium]
MPQQRDTPFGRGIGLGRFRGVQVAVHWSVLALLVLVTVLLGASVLPAAHRGAPTYQYWLVGALVSVLFVVSVGAHELAHAVVARRYGMRVERMTLWLLGGLTELDGEPPTPGADAWIAAAGPLTTVLVGGAAAGVAAVAGTGSVVGSGFVWLTEMSGLLAIFNLLPAAPLDGGRLLRAITWRATGSRDRGVAAATRAGRALGIILIFLGVLTVLAGNVAGLWFVVIGWFVSASAQTERYAGRTERLGRLRAADVMSPAALVFPSWWTVAAAESELRPDRAAQPAFPLVDLDGRAVGAVTPASLSRVPAGRAGQVVLSDVSRRVRAPIVGEQTPVVEVALKIHLRAHVAVVVNGSGHPVGVIDEQVL